MTLNRLCSNQAAELLVVQRGPLVRTHRSQLRQQELKITTEASKYNYALKALPQDVLAECEHVIESPSNEKYTLLKRALLKANGKSAAKKNAKLLAMTAHPGGIGDRKPSNLLMKIRTLSGSGYEALEPAMFLSQLPAAVRTALANSRAANNEELGVEADNAWKSSS